jgi:hypothetical protein
LVITGEGVDDIVMGRGVSAELAIMGGGVRPPGGGVRADSDGSDVGAASGFASGFTLASRRMVSIESSTDSSAANPDPEGGFVVIPDTLPWRVSLPGIWGGCQAW